MGDLLAGDGCEDVGDLGWMKWLVRKGRSFWWLSSVTQEHGGTYVVVAEQFGAEEDVV